jgi:hypothetical protein
MGYLSVEKSYWGILVERMMRTVRRSHVFGICLTTDQHANTKHGPANHSRQRRSCFIAAITVSTMPAPSDIGPQSKLLSNHSFFQSVRPEAAGRLSLKVLSISGCAISP